MRHPHRHHQPAAARLRAGLRASVLAVLALFSMLVPHWPAGLPATATAMAAHAAAGGEEVPAGEFAEQEAPAKLRRVASVQAPRTTSWNHPPPAGLPVVAVSTPLPHSATPATAPTPPPATHLHWRLQYSQAPPQA